MNAEFERTYQELLRANHNSLRLPLKRMCARIEIAYSTVANKRSRGEWPNDLLRIDRCEITGKWFVSVFEAARFLSGGRKEDLQARRGAPTLAERQAAAQAGKAVSEMRREKQNG